MSDIELDRAIFKITNAVETLRTLRTLVATSDNPQVAQQLRSIIATLEKLENQLSDLQLIRKP